MKTISILVCILLNITLLFSQNQTMDNTTKEIMIQGKGAIIAYAFDILEEKVPLLKINPKDYEINVWVNKTKAFVEFKRRIRFIPMGKVSLDHDIEVDLINKKVTPFEDWSYDKSRFFIPSEKEKEKIKFVKKHAGIPVDGFDCTVFEREDYHISITNEHSYNQFHIDKITGEKSLGMEGSYTVQPMLENDTHDEDPIKEIYDSTTQEEILEIISIETLANLNMDEFIEITALLSIKEFEKIKKFILNKGDRRTYRNIDNNNPHYHFDDFHAYLNSEIGQRNLYNDPEISDFNEITIHDWNRDIQYYTIRIVRKGVIENELITVDIGIRKDSSIYRMKESNVYLLNPYKKDLNVKLKYLKEHYLVKLRDQINTNR